MADPIFEKASWRDKVALWPRAPLEMVLAITGPYITFDFAAAGASNEDWRGPLELLGAAVPYLFFLAIVLLIAQGLCRRFSKFSIPNLLDRARRAQELEDLVAEGHRELADGMLLAFGKKLDLATADQSRISLYVRYDDNSLKNLGRYATNPRHQSTGRSLIPVNEGVVGQAWETGWQYHGDLGSGAAYTRSCTGMGIARATVNDMKMKPRMICALQMKDSTGIPIAVMVFESKRPDLYSEDQIREEMEDLATVFAHTLPQMMPHLPKASLAASEGL